MTLADSSPVAPGALFFGRIEGTELELNVRELMSCNLRYQFVLVVRARGIAVERHEMLDDDLAHLVELARGN